MQTWTSSKATKAFLKNLDREKVINLVKVNMVMVTNLERVLVNSPSEMATNMQVASSGISFTIISNAQLWWACSFLSCMNCNKEFKGYRQLNRHNAMLLTANTGRMGSAPLERLLSLTSRIVSVLT